MHNNPRGGPLGCGGLLLLFGLIETTLLFLQPPVEWKLAKDGVPSEGRVVAVDRAGWHFSSGGDQAENQRRYGERQKYRTIMRYEFTYVTDTGEKRKGTSYAQGTRYVVGETITVQYLPDRPDRACIKGARTGVYPWAARFVPQTVFLFILWGIGSNRWRHRQAMDLLRNGVADRAHVTHVTAEMDGKAPHLQRTVVTLRLPEGISFTRTERDRSAAAEFIRIQEAGETIWVIHDPALPERFILPELL